MTQLLAQVSEATILYILDLSGRRSRSMEVVLFGLAEIGPMAPEPLLDCGLLSRLRRRLCSESWIEVRWEVRELLV